MSDPELTSTVRPRPQSDEPRAVAALAPTLTEAAELPEAADALVRHRDTLIGDLAFLIRFAFDRF